MKRRTFLGCATVSVVSNFSGCSTLSPRNTPDTSPTSEVELTVEPSKLIVETGDNTIEATQFTLQNHSDQPVSINPFGWAIEKQTDTAWDIADTGDDTVAHREMPSDGKHVWSLSLRVHSSPNAEWHTSIVADLDEGRYRFVFTGFTEDEGKEPLSVQFPIIKQPATTG